MTPLQQLLLGVGASKKTYLDDVFSIDLHVGEGVWPSGGSNQTITNGIDLSGEGGMVWHKSRDHESNHAIWDTERGNTKHLYTNSNGAEITDTSSPPLASFNNNGFTLGDGSSGWDLNKSGKTQANWTFRKAPGFFDVVAWDGNGTAGRTISHNLGCVPGLILIKRTDAAAKWIVYHRDTGASKSANLNNTNAFGTDVYSFNQTEPTSTHFSVGEYYTNVNNEEYVAYLFAGGESTAATARSVDFDGSGDFLSVGSTSDFQFGTGDYTVEAWLKPEDLNNRVWLSFGTNNPSFKIISGKWEVYNPAVGSSIYSGVPAVGQWTHYAIARSSGTTKIFINGIETNSFSDTLNVPTQGATIGAYSNDTFEWKGGISNVRVVKGTAVYTSSFKPPTEPLTSITNTKLLCCNNSSVTGTTTGTVTSSGDPTASSDSPFDDPAGFKFGDAGDQNVIKCGSYVGNGSSTGPEIYLGWEPQYILIKRSSASESWMIFDAMRGMTTQANNDHDLRADLTNSEGDTRDYIDITPTGFKQVNTQAMMNGDGDTYIYMCIRRSDGYVGKPAEAGTDVFTTVASPNNTNEPLFVSNFIVDFALQKSTGSTSSWFTGARLTGDEYLNTNSNSSKGNMGTTYQTFDMNDGWWNGGAATQNGYNSWMWKRHAGFDVVTYDGTGAAAEFAHSLNQTPEMVILKPRDQNIAWAVFHSGLSANTKQLELDSTAGESNSGFTWSPTSTHFNVGTAWEHNRADYPYLALLFSSVSGISKVGSFEVGTSDATVTTGFQPRFLIFKRSDGSGGWFTVDTTRGWGSGDDNYLMLQSNAAQTAYAIGEPTSTGFTIDSGWGDSSPYKYIYYAHA